MNDAGQERVRRLPPGPHGLPPELVERNQRERVIAAMAEVCGERGYAESSVAEVVKRAGVSTATFYRQFKDKQECMLASFEELFERLLEEVEGACLAEEPDSAGAGAGAARAAELLSADPPTARLLCLEILAAGTDGIRAQHEALDRLASLLGDRYAPARSPDAAWATVAGMVALVGKRLIEGKGVDPAELKTLAHK